MSVVALSFVRAETRLYRKYQCSLKTGHVNAFVSSWRFAGTSLIRAIFVGFIEDMIHLTVTRQKQVEKHAHAFFRLFLERASVMEASVTRPTCEGVE